MIDTELQMVFIPIDKVQRAIELINHILNKKNNKTRLKTLQKLTGFLNFLCKSIVPGRAFTRRLYAYTKGVLKPHHHIYIKQEMKLDLTMWLQFLKHPSVFSRKFMDMDAKYTAEEISMFSDASANKFLGCGGFSEESWYILQWDDQFIAKHSPSINYLELYGVTVAILLWIQKYTNKNIILFCDNMSVVHMINSNTSNCKNCMVLIRLIVLQGLFHNVKINARHISGKSNTYSDLLSRLKYKQFRQLARKEKKRFNNKPESIPQMIWPMEKIWLSDK